MTCPKCSSRESALLEQIYMGLTQVPDEKRFETLNLHQFEEQERKEIWARERTEMFKFFLPLTLTGVLLFLFAEGTWKLLGLPILLCAMAFPVGFNFTISRVFDKVAPPQMTLKDFEKVFEGSGKIISGFVFAVLALAHGNGVWQIGGVVALILVSFIGFSDLFKKDQLVAQEKVRADMLERFIRWKKSKMCFACGHIYVCSIDAPTAMPEPNNPPQVLGQ